ncbi:MAG: acetylxylan esterase [Bryobacteraceae bacterium]
MKRICPIFLYAAAVAAQAPAPPSSWFTDPLLSEPARQSAMYSFVNENIPPLPRFTSVADWQRYRDDLKPRLLRLLGIDDILAAHKLRLVHKGILERGDFTIEKIAYESYPGMWVSALVWAPRKIDGKAPAAVSISGHLYCESKAGDYVQQRNYNLVQRGFVVISYDYFGCGERGRPEACRPDGWGGIDHTNSLFSYTSRTPTGIEVLDGIRAIDYLYSRPDVDRARILFTGESGGGNNTYWVSALDTRVTLSVPVSSGGAFEQWIKEDVNYDWHQRPPGLRAIADIGTLYALIAPRPLLIVNGHPELTEFSLPDAMRSYRYAQSVYRLYGKTDAIAFHESVTGHGYQEDKRTLMYGWVDRWFFGGKMPHAAADLPYRAEPRESLLVGLPEDNLSIAAMAARWVKESLRDPQLPLSEPAALAWQTTERSRLDPLLGRDHPEAAPGVIDRDGYALESGGYQAENVRLEVARDLILPGVFVRKAGQPRYKAVLLLEKHRGNSDAAHKLLDAGYAVFAMDPRGTGEMRWDSRTSNWANFMGRPAVGLWAEDISKATTYLLARRDVSAVAVLGYGSFGKAALYAAALDTRIAAAAVATDTLSYRQEAMSGLVHIYADVPRILAWGDTAQVAALVAPRPLAVVAAGLPQSLNGEKPDYFSPMPRFEMTTARTPESAVEANYNWTLSFYRLLGAGPNFRAGGGEESAAAWLAAHF